MAEQRKSNKQTQLKIFKDRDREDYGGTYFGQAVFVSEEVDGEVRPDDSHRYRLLVNRTRFVSVLRYGYFGDDPEKKLKEVITEAPLEEVRHYTYFINHTHRRDKSVPGNPEAVGISQSEIDALLGKCETSKEELAIPTQEEVNQLLKGFVDSPARLSYEDAVAYISGKKVLQAN